MYTNNTSVKSPLNKKLIADNLLFERASAERTTQNSGQSKFYSSMQTSNLLNNNNKMNLNLSNSNNSIINSNNNIGALFNNVEDITRAINNLNNLVNAMGTNID
jgi:hypothetical protein